MLYGENSVLAFSDDIHANKCGWSIAFSPNLFILREVLAQSMMPNARTRFTRAVRVVETSSAIVKFDSAVERIC